MGPATVTNIPGNGNNGFVRRNGLDHISKLILQILHDAAEPLETKDIESRCRNFDSKITRIKVFYRLQNLRAEGHLKGKFIGSGKGSWIWWFSQASPTSKSEARSESRRAQQRIEQPSAEAFSHGDISND